MPTEDVKQELGKVFIKTADGEIQELKGVTNLETKVENNDDALDAMKYATKSIEKTFDLTISKETSRSLQKMLGIQRITRKRFIKLLMGLGIQRNESMQLAKITRENECCYSPMMVQILFEIIMTLNKVNGGE